MALRSGTSRTRTQDRLSAAGDWADDWSEPEKPQRDWKKLFLIVGLAALSWVATYVGMLELIESNLGDLPFIHKIIIGFSVAMLMTMVIWLLDKMFSPIDWFTKACYIGGYLFLSIISVGFGFGFYWKVLESRGEASRSAESAIAQVQSSLYAASTRLEQLQSTLAQLTTDVHREGGGGARQRQVLPQQRARRRAAPQDARRGRRPLQVRLRLRQGRASPRSRATWRRSMPSCQDRRGRPGRSSTPRPATATSSCAGSAASSTSP